MSRRPLVILALVVALLPVGDGGADAQNGTPAAGAARGASTRDLLLQATLQNLPATPAIVRLRRVALEPEAATETSAPAGPEFVLVETGAPVATVDGTAVLLAATGARQTLAAGAEVALLPGDRLAFPLGTPRAFRNDAADDAVLLIASVIPADGEETADADADGVITESLGQGTAADLPAGDAAVTLERFRLTAGTGVPAYPGPTLLAVEAGGFASSLDAGDVQLSQGGAPGASPSAGSGEVFPVRPGDALFFPRGMAATPPLEGDGELVVLRLGIRPIETAAEGEAVYPVGAVVVVARPDVRLRDAPSVNGTVLAGLTEGQPLTITGPPEAGSGRLWYPVEAPDDPTLAGYVAAEFLAAG